jgi:hypothetical protein
MTDYLKDVEYAVSNLIPIIWGDRGEEVAPLDGLGPVWSLSFASERELLVVGEHRCMPLPEADQVPLPLAAGHRRCRPQRDTAREDSARWQGALHSWGGRL